MSEDEKGRLKQREEFLRLMSHEMRTPLNGVIGMLGLLSRTKMDGAQKAYVTAARASAEHMLGLVNDLLDFARIEAGKLELENAPVDVEGLVQGVAELLSPRAHDKGLEIAWAVDAAVPEIVADDGRLRQILFNLAGNAVKFTETGGVLIRVTAQGAARGGRSRVRFSISDSGPGVPEEARERIFEEFGHANPHHATRYGGAGLGLAVVKRLAEAMGGKVGVESRPGQGATFWFEAPFERTEAPGHGEPLAGVEVAIVTPSAHVREAACAQVAAAGGRAASGQDIDAVLARLPEEAPVLVDHALAGERPLMPKPRGRRALILLKPEERHLIEKYRGAGYLGYLIKPLRRVSLAERVLAIAPGAPAVASRVEDERVAPAGVAGVRVLLAEDNPVNALLVQTLLKREGCTVELAGTGEEALAALARGRYDLVLMDMRMPGMDGPETARALRAREDATPIIALTANAFEEDRRVCLESGMNAFLTKPLEPAALRSALIRWTNRDSRVKLAS